MPYKGRVFEEKLGHYLVNILDISLIMKNYKPIRKLNVILQKHDKDKMAYFSYNFTIIFIV